MKKNILVSIDLIDYFESNSRSDLVKKLVDKIHSFNCNVAFFSRDYKRVNFFKIKYPGITFLTRKNIQDTFSTITNEKKSSFVIVGNKDAHFQDAVNAKLLFIVPTFLNYENKAYTYGIKVNTLKQLVQFIETLSNQNSWYSTIKLPDETQVISLSDGRSYPKYAKTVEEREIVKLFRAILKDKKTNMYEVYLYHFLAAISNRRDQFFDVNDWACFPSSSSGNITSNEMYKFKEVVRCMMKGGTPRNSAYTSYPNLFVRYKDNIKTHSLSSYERTQIGATTHFDTIHINPAYRDKLKGRKVCVFDDYLTHGNSFEAARNLLRKAGVSNIIFVTLGRFPYDYMFQEYSISGDIYTPNYTYKLESKSFEHNFTINVHAKQEVENLYNIFDL